MNTSPFRATCAAILALAMLAPVTPLFAQQNAAPKPAMAPTPQAVAPVAAPPQAQSQPLAQSQPQAQAQTNQPAATDQPASASTPSQDGQAAASVGDATTSSADSTGGSLKSAFVVPHELSPWSMFLAADIIVKVVMLGLAFASLMTWTVFIAKTIELSMAQSKLRSALAKTKDARSLVEAQLALGKKGSVLAMLIAAALGEARLSAGLSSDEGIKERAASSFSEIVRAEGRRIRIGMGLLASIGSTAPFIGLFGTVWGIMNSFIGISKSQTTNLAVVAPGIAEALLATAIGLVAAIPAVIIYNHFARLTKGYLELVSRSSGAAARLLSRDLDRSQGAVHARAAE
jgi:biopolymer transport protein ExbB